jgi:hypothetical protein
MSVGFDKEIYSDDHISLRANFTGIVDNETTHETLKMTLFAINKHTGQPVFNTTLSFETIRDLYTHLNSISIIRDAESNKSARFIESSEEIQNLLSQLESLGAKALGPILKKITGSEKVTELLQNLTDIELDSLSAAYKHQTYKQELENLEKLLELEETGNIVKELPKNENLLKYAAKQPEKVFQNWIEQNIWVFGVEYTEHYEARKIAMSSEADLLMESLDGFLDLIELKRPKLEYELLQFDKSHNCYYPSKPLSEVIGQSLFYLQKMDEYKAIIENEYKVKVLRPRVKIVAGRTKDFDEAAFEALRMLNSNMNNIQIMSYDYLLSCGRKIISNFD